MDPVSTSNDAGEGPQTLVFTPNQIACVCNVLMEKGDYERLTKFMLSLPNDKSLYQNEDVVRAQCVALFHINDFKGLYSTLENHSFSSEHHQFLQVTPHLGTIHDSSTNQINRVKSDIIRNGRFIGVDDERPSMGRDGSALLKWLVQTARSF